MRQLSMFEYAEMLRRAGTLTEAEKDKLLARAITDLEDYSDHCALLLSIAEQRPSEAVKLALLYNCNKHNEVAASCAALFCYLCGKAESPFDPNLADLFALFDKHTNYFQRKEGLDRLTALTGYTTRQPDEFCFLDVPELPPEPAPVQPPPLPPLPRTVPARPVPRPPVAPPAASSGLSPTFEIDSEMRGETIHYIEPHRRTSMQFFWTRGYQIHADTITTWFFPADKHTEPVTPQERLDIVARVVAYAATVQGVTMEVVNEAWMKAQAAPK